jgi:hypothetical protein
MSEQLEHESPAFAPKQYAHVIPAHAGSGRRSGRRPHQEATRRGVAEPLVVADHPSVVVDGHQGLCRRDAPGNLEELFGHWDRQAPRERDRSLPSVIDVRHGAEERERLRA